MTSRERIEAALKHMEPDRTPIFEYVLLSPVADKILGHKYTNYIGDKNKWSMATKEMGWEKAVRRYAEDRIRLAGILGHDLMYIPPNPLPGTSNNVSCGEVKRLEEIDDPVEKLMLRNEEAGMELSMQEDRYLVYHYVKEEMKKSDMDIPIIVPAYYHGVWDDVDLMQVMLIEPDVAHKHFTLATKKTINIIDEYGKLGIDQFGIGGDFAGNRPIISPESYSKFIVPELRILSRYIHAKGGWAVNTSDGNLWSVIDDFLINSEVDGYMEIDMRAGMDLSKLKKIFGDRITFYGNMDCSDILSFGSIDEIKKYTLDCLTAGSGNGGHIFCASNAISASVPFENYITMHNTYRDIFNLPKQEII